MEMSGARGFTRTMTRLCEKIMLLHYMEEDDWTRAAAILREVSRLAMTAAYYCDQEAVSVALSTRPALEPE